jgi:hypothetical protein
LDLLLLLDDLTDVRKVHLEMISDRSLRIPVLLYGFSNFSVPLQLVPKNLFRKDLFKVWPVRVPLAFGDFRYIFVFCKMPRMAVHKRIVAKKCLPFYCSPNGLLVGSPLNKPIIFLLGLASL